MEPTPWVLRSTPHTPKPKDHEQAGTGRAKWEPAYTAPGEGVTTDLNAHLIRWSPDDHNPNHSGREQAGTRQRTRMRWMRH